MKTPDLEGVEYGFTTRDFPLFLKKTDDLTEPANQERLKALIGGDRFVFLEQTHGSGVVALDDEAFYSRPGFYRVPSADGVITCIPEIVILVLSADCLPVFFSVGKWIGLVHAGWRGTREGIALEALRLLLEKSGSEAGETRIVFGPGICGEHYEVGEEFLGYFPGVETQNFAALRRREKKLYFDLAGENKRQLLSAGVHSQNITDTKRCTYSEGGDFHSYRREGDRAGRIISYIVKR